MRILLFLLLLASLPLLSFSHGSPSHPFVENKGQWISRIAYSVTLPHGNLFIEKSGFAYHLMDRSYFRSLHTASPENPPEYINSHGLFVKFLDSNDDTEFNAEGQSSHYYNFLVGDQTRHASYVRSYEKVTYSGLYDGIDLAVYNTDYDYLKYDFIVSVGSNPSDIKAQYDGADKIYLKNGHLVIETSITQIVEQAPIAYQLINGVKVDVPCKFKLKDNVLSYRFPKGYNKNHELIIDPVLIFSSFTGSSADNFGFTATYDNAQNTYVGGIVFGVGSYPTTAGAFQTSFNGAVAGSTDIGISKFNSAGTSLLYSTYIGGAIGSEAPHSLIVNDNQELYILGTTSSSDFPVSAGCYQAAFNGGASVMPTNSGMNYTNGSDIIISRLSADGTTLLSGTFVGGTGNDGLNVGDSLAYNYGDPFRGEIILDANQKPIVATTTTSLDFPTTLGATQFTYGGGDSDGCAFRLNETLTTLEWSTYIGASGEDSGYGIQLSSSGEMYVTGGTTSPDLNISASAHISSHSGFIDGYLVRYNSSGTAMLSSTFIGTSEYDQAYFVQLDQNDDVYVVGQTTGNYPVTPTCYNNPNSGQFIQKYSPNLSTSLWSTVIGSGSGDVDFSPSAFLVNDCGLIYLSGWGGSLAGLGTYQADNSSTNGLPVSTTASNPAFQSTTDGSDFYLMVLNEDANGLLYATFFGGPISTEHVDGGTSRFDKNGIVYQAVCAGCGGNSDFPTTPGVWSTTNNSTNCNLGAFKFGLGNINTSISIPQPYVCIPNSFQFFNNSVGGNQYFWDFGDGDTSDLFEPQHDYTDTGTFMVTLIVSDSTGCIESDTANLFIEVHQLDNAGIQPADSICPGDTIQLSAAGGVSYEWFPSTYLSNPNSPEPLAYPPVTTSYMMIATDSCGADTAYTTIYVHDTSYTISSDTTICGGIPTQLIAAGGISYSWEPASLMSGSNTATPTITTFDTTTVFVEITTPGGCVVYDSLSVNTITGSPIPEITNDTTICMGDSVQLVAGGAPQIEFISPSFANPTDSIQVVSPNSNTTYLIAFTNQCGTVYDSVEITVMYLNPTISPDTLICPGDTASLFVTGGVAYSWSPAETLSTPDSSHTSAWPLTPTTYSVHVTASNGCSKTIQTTVGIYPLPDVNAGIDQYIPYGADVQLAGISNMATTVYWSTTDTLSCYSCYDPIAQPQETSAYVFHVIDANGCENRDTVMVYLDGSLYVPNAFTPNGDGKNDFFVILGKEIVRFNLRIFDRWGLQLFSSDNMDNQWDGKYQGEIVQVDTYVWSIEYEDSWGRIGSLKGHVSVIR